MAHVETDMALQVFKTVHMCVKDNMFYKMAELKKNLRDIEIYYGNKAKEYSQAFQLIQNRVRMAAYSDENVYFDLYLYVMEQLDKTLATELNRDIYKHNVLALCHPRRNEGTIICAAYTHYLKARQLCAVCLSTLPSTYCAFFCCKTFICVECANICVTHQLAVPNKADAICVACYSYGENGPFKRPTDTLFNYTFTILEQASQR